ncbi:hypothetical protein [Reinekea sp. G2M2-21]|uniref:hypothetical protein n=1 Tax=Reinekea sp. G2M2-21 TaxID=2788942 RepID=UPI0018AAA590|nr:hypothetical protein [Reinekea sp. G2M2-21]
MEITRTLFDFAKALPIWSWLVIVPIAGFSVFSTVMMAIYLKDLYDVKRGR